MPSARRAALLGLSLSLLASPLLAGGGQPVSLALTPSTEPAGGTESVVVAAGGCCVAFHSTATNLVPDDTNGWADVFVVERATGDVERVSVSDTDQQADRESFDAAICADGRFVAFLSWAALTADDNNWTSDIFVRDRLLGTTTRVSVASDGTEANDRSYAPAISADGRFVAFLSLATNLVAGDTNGLSDLFVHDRQTDATTRVSVAADGTEGNGDAWPGSLSADARYVAFVSQATNLAPGATNGAAQVLVKDRQTGAVALASADGTGTQGNGWCYRASISGDGRYVAFDSWASNLVAADTNGTSDVFVRDLVSGTTVRASVYTSGAQAPWGAESPAISLDGAHVAFQSSTPLVPPDDALRSDVFVRDLAAGTTARISVSTTGGDTDGESWLPSISADGGLVAFHSTATGLVEGDSNGAADAFVRDTAAATTLRAPEVCAPPPAGSLLLGDGPSGPPDSGPFGVLGVAGERVAFASSATNLVAADTNAMDDVFVRDLATGLTWRVSEAADGTEANAPSAAPALAAGGGFVAFDSQATNLVAVDGNLGIRDVFVRDLATGQVSIASLTDGEAGANGASSAGALSGDGRYVAFVSLAGNLVAGDTNGSQDVFLRDRVGLTTTLVSVATSGGPGSAGSYGPAISADGRYVAFWSYAPNLVAGDTNGCGDVFVRDRQSGTTELVSISTAGLQGDESSYDPDISADGRYVAFRSEATNLVAGDTNTLQDLFVHDRVTHETTRVSVASGGGQVAGTFYPPTISADGRRIAFAALACDLAPGPCQGRQIYLHDRQENLTIRVSAGLDGTADRGEAWDAALRADGERVVFSTEAANLAAGDANGLRDVYLWSLVVQLDGFEDGSLCGWSGIWGGAPCG